MRKVHLTWPGGDHDFRLRIGELRSLQQATGAGPEELYQRINRGHWRIDDLIQVIRWGLVGAGEMKDGDAARFVTPLVDLHPLSQFRITAAAILAMTLLPIEGDPVGEETGETEMPPESGSSPSSTAPEPS